MITIPPAVLRIGRKVAEFAIKNAPKVMVAGGAICVGAGTVMACEATLKADDILIEHQSMMNRVKEAQEVSDEYTEADVRSDKVQIYIHTARRFVKLYGPAISVELTGLGLLVGAFAIMNKRYSGAVAALSALDQAFTEYRARVDSVLTPEQVKQLESPAMTKVDKPLELPWDEPEDTEHVSIDPTALEDPFFFIFDSNNKNWYGDSGFLINKNFVKSTIDAFNLQLQSHSRNHVFLNDILRALDIEETEIGHYYGWTDEVGDSIVVDIVPFVKQFTDDNSDQFPMLVPLPIEQVKELELSGDTEGWGYGLQFKSTAGVGGVPRMIAKCVF